VTDDREDLGSGFDASASQATRARRQELGQRAAMALQVIMRNAKNYDERNAVFAAPIQAFLSAIDGLIATDGAFELRLDGDAVRANRQIIKLDAISRQVLEATHADLGARGVVGLRAVASASEHEFRALVGLLRGSRRLTNVGDPASPFPMLELVMDERSDEERRAPVSVHEEMVRAYAAGVLFAARTIGQLRDGGEVAPIWAAGRVVRQLVDLQGRAPLAMLEMSRTKADGEAYWGHHAANVAVLAISFGARLGLKKRRRHDLGMSGLFHDVGMAALPPAVLGKPGALDDRERYAVDVNPLFAARVLLRDREVHPAALERALAAYECHLRLDATTGDTPDVGLCGRVVAICEAFDALTSARPYRAALAPQAAVSVMYTEMANKFDTQLLGLFSSVIEPLL